METTIVLPTEAEISNHSIREMRTSDVDRIREIYNKHFRTEFDFPDFMKGFLCAYVVEDVVNREIICAGGVRNIAEVVVITNKDLSTRRRRNALFNVLDASTFVAGKFGHDAIHAFCMDEKWSEQLRTVGFHTPNGHPLMLEL